MEWTPERVERLKELHAQGFSNSQIAGILGGVTRNAVIGKITRMGLAGRAIPSPPKSFFWSEDRVARLRELAGVVSAADISREMGIPTTRIHDKAQRMGISLRLPVVEKATQPQRITTRIARMIADDEIPPPDARGLTVVQMPTIGRCRFPKSGSGVHLLMCGEPTIPDTATYCPACARRAYQPRKQGDA